MTDVRHEFEVNGDPPVLQLANNDDPHYVETFRNWGEVEEFISNMRFYAAAAFGPKREIIRQWGES